MTIDKTGGVAFPACNEANMNGTMGMTLRDYFAGQALIALVSDPHFRLRDATLAGHASYSIADAMIKAREAE